jgi:hypothetical protein
MQKKKIVLRIRVYFTNFTKKNKIGFKNSVSKKKQK